MNEWRIQSRSRECQACGRAFEDGAVYHTLLFEERAAHARQDVCEGCWEEQFRHGAADRKGFVSHWQGVFVVPPPPPPDPIQRDSAESLLRRLTEQQDPAWQPAAFILAVMLERKRLLKLREQLKQDGRRVLVYELPKSGEVFTLTDPDLHLDQLEQVQRDVARLLESGLPEETSPEGEAAGASAEAPSEEASPEMAAAEGPPETSDRP